MGWSYEDWDGVFYPEATDSRERLKFYAQTFDAVEIDSTFYGTPRESVIESWSRATPDNFVFCSKVPSQITHELGLRDCMEPLSEFVHAMAGLGAKRGPMLFQMPPSFSYREIESLQDLLSSLCRLDDPDPRFAIEFRHRSLLREDVISLLRKHNVALASTDYDGMPRSFHVTARFSYVRLIGNHGAFARHKEVQQDRSEAVVKWGSEIAKHQTDVRDCWVFCNNDYEGYAPETGRRMLASLGLPTRTPAAQLQGKLF
jgi:uncharacterized protein YecE (DUF72 family)